MTLLEHLQEDRKSTISLLRNDDVAKAVKTLGVLRGPLLLKPFDQRLLVQWVPAIWQNALQRLQLHILPG